VELPDFVRLLRRNWAILIALVLLGALASGYLSYTQKPQYQSTAKVFVSVQDASTVSDLSQGNTFAQQVIKSYADAATTPLVLDRVIQQLGLQESSAELAQRISVNVVLDEVVLEVQVTDTSPRRAADIANAVSTRLRGVVNVLTPGAGDTSPVQITMLQPAQPVASPVRPRPLFDVLLGALLGLVLGLLLAVLRHALDNKVRSERDVVAITTRPILGGIQYHSGAKSRPLIVQDDPNGVRAESYRSLRTNLQFLSFGRNGRAIVVTSPSEAEGKTTTAANLAITVAATGEATLLMDADLRAPRVGTTMGIDPTVGLADVLAGQVPIERAVQRWGDSGLHVLPAGHQPPNPAELLQSKVFAQLLKDLRRQYSTIIIDTPPLLPVSDAAVVTRRASGAIVVCAASRTTKHRLRVALASLDQVNARVLGIVLSMVSTRGPDAYAYGRARYQGRGIGAGGDSGGASASHDARTVGPDTEAIPVVPDDLVRR
jgi:succinoglycan biosynthesis transport protein ExoP